MTKIAILILSLIFAALTALLIGPLKLGPAQALLALLGNGEPVHVTVMQQLRLPRAALAIIIGAGLGASGAALQGYTRNPLAGPGILGFSACAALGAVTALYFGLRGLIAPAALLGTLSGAVLILSLVGARKGANILILAGIGISALATAITGLIMNFAPNPWALSEIVYWLMGSLRDADYSDLLLCLPLTLVGLGALLLTGSDLRTLSLGEDTAVSLGVNLRRVQILLIIGVSLCVGSSVAVAGAIGFIGLFVPHILRFIFGPDPARLIPLSALGGAATLALADSGVKLLASQGTSLYLGILTAMIGAPFFLWLAIKGTRHD